MGTGSWDYAMRRGVQIQPHRRRGGNRVAPARAGRGASATRVRQSHFRYIKRLAQIDTIRLAAQSHEPGWIGGICFRCGFSSIAWQ